MHRERDKKIRRRRRRRAKARKLRIKELKRQAAEQKPEFRLSHTRATSQPESYPRRPRPPEPDIAFTPQIG